MSRFSTVCIRKFYSAATSEMCRCSGHHRGWQVLNAQLDIDRPSLPPYSLRRSCASHRTTASPRKATRLSDVTAVKRRGRGWTNEWMGGQVAVAKQLSFSSPLPFCLVQATIDERRRVCNNNLSLKNCPPLKNRRAGRKNQTSPLFRQREHGEYRKTADDVSRYRVSRSGNERYLQGFS